MHNYNANMHQYLKAYSKLFMPDNIKKINNLSKLLRRNSRLKDGTRPIFQLLTLFTEKRKNN